MKIAKQIQKLRNWILELNENQDGVSATQPTATRDFAIIVGLIVTSLVASVLATWIAQEMLNYNFPAALVIGMIIVLILAAVLQIKGFPFRLKPLQIMSFLLTLIIIQSVIIAYIFIINRPSTTYLVFDATETTIPYYPELIQNIRLAARVQNPKSLGGLRIYGGQVQGETDCRDTTQLISPTPAKDFEQELDKAFGSFDPRGNASLTTAVLTALRDDLNLYKGPIKLIVITSGLDPKCEPEWGGIFEEIAEDILANTTKDITIAIVGVGDLSPTEESILQDYADAFHGSYLNASKPAELNSIILGSSSYLSKDGEN